MSSITTTSSSAPGKLMLAGSYAVVHGRPCVVTAIDQRLVVKVEKISEQKLIINAADIGVKEYEVDLDKIGSESAPKAVTFIESCLDIFQKKHPLDTGLVVTTQSDFSSKVGFGSSSAVTVAFIHALHTLFGISISKKELFNMCYQVVIAVQGVGSGFDIAAAIWGGTIKYVKPAAVIEELNLSDEILSEHIVVCFTGQKADTATLVKRVNKDLEREPQKINRIFDEIGQTADSLYQALSVQDWENAGKALLRHQNAAAQLGVSTDKIDTLARLAMQAGSYGASLSGAGGGDSMPIFVSKANKQKVITALEKEGQVIPVSFHAPGVKTEA